MNFTLKKSTFSHIILSLLLASCVAVVGPTTPVPNIPEGDAISHDEMIYSSVSIESFRDVRSEPEDKKISPEGDVNQSVQAAFTNALRKRGVTISNSAPISIHAEIRTWHAITRGKGELESEASLYIEVHSNTGNRIFSAIYNGHRSSTFPLISAEDINDSLGLSMAQAIDQCLYDASMRNVISGR